MTNLKSHNLLATILIEKYPPSQTFPIVIFAKHSNAFVSFLQLQQNTL